MKLLPFIAALALAHPVAAHAQSITDTHDMIWYPSGKTPSSTYRPRDKATCTNRHDDHRAGKGLWSARVCPAAVKKPTPLIAARGKPAG